MDKNHSGNKKYSVSVVGATGLIGRKILGTLYKRRFPISGLRVFASEKSEGKKIFVKIRAAFREKRRDRDR